MATEGARGTIAPTKTVIGIFPTSRVDFMVAPSEPRRWQNRTPVGVLAGSGLEAKYNSLLASHGDTVIHRSKYSLVSKELNYRLKGDPGINFTDSPTKEGYADAFREVWQFVFELGLELKGYVNIPVGYMFSAEGKPICVWIRCEKGNPIVQISKQVADQKMVDITSSQAELVRVRLFNEIPDSVQGRWVDESFDRTHRGQPLSAPPVH